MGLLADAVRQRVVAKGPPCGVQALPLDDETRADLTELLADVSIPATLIRAELEAMGYRVGEDALRRHRRGVCQCRD